LVLGGGGRACAPKPIEPPVQSQAGYSVSLHTAPDRIWMTPPILNSPKNYLGFVEIVVEVRDVNGRPVDGVPVEFQLESSWKQSALLTPPRALTQDGKARAVVEPNTTGIMRVTAQVDNVTRQGTFLVENQQTGNGTASPALPGLPYPPY
jgi:hypothetical protein